MLSTFHPGQGSSPGAGLGGSPAGGGWPWVGGKAAAEGREGMHPALLNPQQDAWSAEMPPPPCSCVDGVPNPQPLPKCRGFHAQKSFSAARNSAGGSQTMQSFATGSSDSAVFPLQRAGREALTVFGEVVLITVLMNCLWGLAPDAFQPTNPRVCALVNKVCLAMWFWQPISRSGQQRMLGERIRNKHSTNFLP